MMHNATRIKKSCRISSFTSFWLAYSLFEQGLLVTDSQPFLKRLNHFSIWIGLKATSPTSTGTFGLFQFKYCQAFDKLDSTPLFRHNNKIFPKLKNRQASIT